MIPGPRSISIAQYTVSLMIFLRDAQRVLIPLKLHLLCRFTPEIPLSEFWSLHQQNILVGVIWKL